MTAKFPGCPYGTCHCAQRAMQNGASEADIVSGVVSGVMGEQLLSSMGFRPINNYGTMVLDTGEGIVMIVDTGSQMDSEAVLLQADLIEILYLHEVAAHMLVGLPSTGQIDLMMLDYVAQELVLAEFDAVMLKAQQPVDSPLKPDLMTLMGIGANTPLVIDNDTGYKVDDPVEISSVRAASLFTGHSHHTERICEHA